ncbi:MAG: MBL fold metallo-hydrolase [Selenomonas sp.]|uniref:MBL fold metallo-hydrolase n=1 Tax=Selenomonas sp. TaxID=2053611 RepID=UPI0025FED71C|nr:MBL fold metallo-hydrolase [Selenomonas sp.]MCR5757430.1 MBL fold metallo-hydrolase [Selenomonas sp.]
MTSKITVLVENTARENSPLRAEHGLSLFVETPENAVLFDCGHTGLAWKNAAALGIDLRKVSSVILSHSHYDHAGGFPSLLTYCQPGRIYTGQNFWLEKFSYDQEGKTYLAKGCGFSPADLSRWQIDQQVCGDFLSLDSYAALCTDFPRHYPFEQIPEKFCRGPQKEPDPFDDEICLLLPEGEDLAMVVGCSHRGILNMVTAVKARTGKRVVRIVGGIHLSQASPEQRQRTLRELAALGVQKLNLCHCSGTAVPGRITTGTVLEWN